MNGKQTLFWSIAILVAAGAIVLLIFSTEPTATQSSASRETAMLVNVTEVERGQYTPVIRVMGTVIPSRDILLTPQVGGEILKRSENFTPGGYVKKGETLIQIDSLDYANALRQSRSELTRARADLAIELGQQHAAQRQYELYGDTLSEANRALVLREPQLHTAQSQVESAEASVRQAELNLERTSVTAPFDARILSRNVDEGSRVSAGQELGRLVGIDTYWIEATIPLSGLRRITAGGEIPEDGSRVHIRNRTAWAEDEYRTGRLYRILGSLDEQTRLARILITVEDPLNRISGNRNRPELMIGSFVEARIEANEIRDVIRLSRNYVRSGNTVWIMKDGHLHIRDVEIDFEDQEYAYITSGLDTGDSVVTTHLSTVSEGAPLRLEQQDESEAASRTE